MVDVSGNLFRLGGLGSLEIHSSPQIPFTISPHFGQGSLLA